MIRPSERAINIAEELLDYVHPGMPRAAALNEVAEMVDEMNAELLTAVNALLAEVEQTGPDSHAAQLNRIRHLMTGYQPWRVEPATQHELFAAGTSTATEAQAVAGQMP